MNEDVAAALTSIDALPMPYWQFASAPELAAGEAEDYGQQGGAEARAAIAELIARVAAPDDPPDRPTAAPDGRSRDRLHAQDAAPIRDRADNPGQADRNHGVTGAAAWSRIPASRSGIGDICVWSPHGDLALSEMFRMLADDVPARMRTSSGAGRSVRSAQNEDSVSYRS